LYRLSMIITGLLAITSLASAAATSVDSTNPRVQSLSLNSDTLQIQGSNLGVHCAGCEVIANYDGIRYSLEVVSWAHTSVTAKLRDLGKTLTPEIQLVTPYWNSQPRLTKVERRLLPESRVDYGRTEHSTEGDLLFFSRRYDSTFGGKGEEEFDLELPLPVCGYSAPIFDSAEIILGPRTRFGNAKITSLPAPGCQRCYVGVGYYWEPTGRLDYQLNIYRRVVDGICKDRIR